MTASPYRHLVYYTTGMANLKISKVIVRVLPSKALLDEDPWDCTLNEAKPEIQQQAVEILL